MLYRAEYFCGSRPQTESGKFHACMWIATEIQWPDYKEKYVIYCATESRATWDLL